MPAAIERKLAAILSADVVGYSRLMAEDEVATVQTIGAYRDEIALLVAQHRGRVVDAPGDNLLAEFPSVSEAVHCAVEVQRVVAARNADLAEERKMVFRIGVHLGEVMVEGDRIYGEGVNVAARLEALADPGGICISQSVRDQVESKLELDYEDLGEQDLKNIARPVRVLRVRTQTGESAPSGTAADPAVGRVSKPAVLSFVLVLLGAGLVAAWWIFARAPGTTAAPVRSLAVLPLENLSGDPEQDYFADGMTEALISSLAKIDALEVTSRTSIMQFKGVHKPLPEIARELGVDALVEGSVLRAGDRVRITAQLIHAPSDSHLWSESYDRDLADVLRLQSEVARAIAGEIRLSLTPGERSHLSSDRSVIPEAYDAYLKGRFFWHKRSAEGFERAIVYFERAIEADPGYAAAHAGLSDAYGLLAGYGVRAPAEAMPRAEAAARKALEIDPNLAEAHASLGWVRAFYHWDWPGAEQSFGRAVELEPRYAIAHFWHGFLLAMIGRSEEAARRLRRAYELDPLVPVFNRGLGRAYEIEGNPDQAIEQYLATIEMNPGFRSAYSRLAAVYVGQGRNGEALDAMRRGDVRNASIYALAGEREEAQRLLQEYGERSRSQYVSPIWFAEGYAALGDEDRAFEWLERAYEERAFGIVGLRTSDGFVPLHEDGRFLDLVRRLRLPEVGATRPAGGLSSP